jgi:competence protein ComEC
MAAFGYLYATIHPWVFFAFISTFVGCARDVADDGNLPFLRWTSLNVGSGLAPAETNIIETSDNRIFLVDVGSRQKSEVVDFLSAKNIKTIDAVIISHAHADHYSGLPSILSGGISVKKVYANIPNREVCDSEIPWGCSFEKYKALLDRCRKAGAKVEPLHTGDVLPISKDAYLDVLYSYDGTDAPVGRTDINDTSIILKLVVGKKSVLFPGDLNAPLGGWLAEQSDNKLKADILKIPHHGTEGFAPNSFLNWVSPTYAIIPSPKALYLSDRSSRIREWIRVNNIPTKVTGVTGNASVLIFRDRIDWSGVN